MKEIRNLFFVFLILTIGICCGEDLDVSINVEIDQTLASYWIKTLQEAYNQFLSFFIDLANNTTALELKTVRDFKNAATVCFNAVKGKKHNKIGDLEKTVNEVTYALTKAIKSGKRAIQDLNSTPEKKLHKKLSSVMAKLKAALYLTITLITPIKNQSKTNITDSETPE
uniref:Uncharacterized protein n=1 Tax=Strigamia maritima TaxID=126957 RepID=T1J5J8_STRMM